MRLVDSYDYGINKKKSPKILELFAVRTGLEPATPCVTGMYSNQAELPHQVQIRNLNSGGADGTRTRDPMRDRHVF